jgi:hypothetical protein
MPTLLFLILITVLGAWPIVGALFALYVVAAVCMAVLRATGGLLCDVCGLIRPQTFKPDPHSRPIECRPLLVGALVYVALFFLAAIVGMH